MIFKPTAHKVLVKPMAAREISEGGIIIPEMAKKKEGFGTVVIAGTPDNTWEIVPLNPGDKIHYAVNAGIYYNEKGQQYLIIQESDIFYKF